MIKALLPIVFIAATWHAQSAAQEYTFGSALTQSVAGVITLIPSSPSVSPSHPALLAASIPTTFVELSYRQLYGLNELEDFTLHASHRFRRLSGGLSFMRFGEAGMYQEYSVAGASSYRLMPAISVGVAIQYTSSEYGDGQSRYAGADLAVSAASRPISSIILSGAIGRITLDKVYDGLHEDLVYEASVAWISPSEVSLGAIWTRERQGDHRFALGQVLNLTQNFDFLAGLRFDPVRYSLGGRALYRGTSLIYSYQGHPDLGATHSFGLAWSR